jgi:putative phosphoesterase
LRIAVFSDVHGNLLQLDAFFKVTASLGIDQYICLGDLCNYYPDNKKVIELIQEKKVICLLGNHDEFYTQSITLSSERKLAYNYDLSLQHSIPHITFLKSLPEYHRINVKDISILFCHGSPIDYKYGYVYPDTDLKIFADIPDQIIFIGHTHRQFIKDYNGKVFCNVGSVGQPRDNGALFGFAILDTLDFSIKLYRKKVEVEQLRSHYQLNTPKAVIDMLEREEKINFEYILL